MEKNLWYEKLLCIKLIEINFVYIFDFYILEYNLNSSLYWYYIFCFSSLFVIDNVVFFKGFIIFYV